MPQLTKKVTKAVFPVAGLGTRFLPATKAMPKELLPIVDKPIIQYAVEEAVEAGIDTLIFVTGRHKRAIEDHFEPNPELEMQLKKNNRVDQRLVQDIIPKDVSCIFVRQKKLMGLGDAILSAEKVVGDEAFAVLLADDFIISDEGNNTKILIDNYYRTRRSVISYMEIDKKDCNKYGIIKRDQSNNAIIGIIEKPSMQSSPSNQANIGRYLLCPDIFNIIKGLEPGANGEIQLADALNFKAKEYGVEGEKLRGKRFDCGSIKGFFDATMYMGKNRGLL